MPLVLADRVRDTTTTTGTGTVTLSGTAPTGYQNFSVIGNGNTTYYTINAGSQWEVGIGTYSSTGPTLARTTVLKSSNANALVSFSAGTKDVFVTYPADEVVIQDGSAIQAGTSVLAVANGGTGVTTSTGTGNVVLSTSPTLVTPTLGAASATSIAAALGAVGTPSYTFTGDTNTGIYSPAADTLAFVEGGVEAMRIDSSGQVGIGATASAGTTLRIGKNLTGAVNSLGVYNNQAIQSDVTTSSQLFSTFPSTAAAAFTLGSLTHFSASQGTIGATSAVTNQYGFLAQSTLTGATNNYGFFSNIASGTGRWNFYAAGTAVNYFEGNVGIGVTAPVDKLQVEGNLYFGTSNRVVYTGGAGNLTLQTNTGVLAFNTGGSVERMRITNAGRVGVNTSNPLSFLGVGSATGQVGFNIGTSSSPERGNLWYDTDGTGWKFNIGKFQSSTFTAQMTFQDNGNVGIGTSSPSALLNVYSATAAFIDLFGDAGTTISAVRSSTDATGANMVLRKARGTTASRTAVASGDTMGTLFFSAFGGTNNRNIASIVGTVGTYTSDADISSNLIFNTTPTGSVSPTERMRVDSGGNVNIGASSATAAGGIRYFDVYNTENTSGSSAADIRLITQNAAGSGTTTVDLVKYKSGAFYISNAETGSGGILGFNTSSTERMRIDSSGNVGIGTSAPSQKLQVAASTNQLSLTTGTNELIARASSTEAALYTFQAIPLVFYNNNAERMRIDSSGNVGIGTASPSFRLDVSGTGRFTGLTQFDNDVTLNKATLNYLYFNDAMAFARNGVGERMRIDSSGNVGIGTSSPAERLHVSGNLLVEGSSGTICDAIVDMVDQRLVLGSYFEAGVGQHSFISSTNNAETGNSPLLFRTGTTERMRITSSGNVGIGTSSPSERLDTGTGNTRTQALIISGDQHLLYSAASTELGIRIGASGPFYGIGTTGSDTMRINSASGGDMLFAIGSTERMRINSSGNVGIGTSSPSSYGRLSVSGNVVLGPLTRNQATTQSVGVWTTGDPADDARANIGFTTVAGAASSSSFITFATNNYGVSGGERMRIDSAGNVGIGTSSPSARLDVSGSNSRSRLELNTTTATWVTTNPAANAYLGAAYDAQSHRFLLSSSEAMRITSGGEVYIAGTADQGAFNLQVNGTGVWGAGAYVNGSDRSLKEEIAPMAEALDVVNALKPVTFRYKEDYSKDQSIQPGFIAQELQEALGGEVYVDGVVQAGPEHLNVAYQSLIPVLVKAIQELAARVAQLEGN